jgi:hypothetical protein
MKNLYLLSVLVLSGFYLNCATILTGTSDRVTVESKPDGARVYVDEIQESITPATLKIQRSIDHTEGMLRMDGYETYKFRFKKQFNWVSILNFTNPFGWAIDIITGAIFKYKPKFYFFEMEKSGN